MKIKLGILGYGMIGKEYLQQALKNNSDFEVVAVWSRSQSSLAHAKLTAPNIKIYDDKHRFLTEVQAVAICTPHAKHVEDARLSLTHGKHVLIEKPIATDATSLTNLMETAKKYPELVVTGLPHDNYPIIEKARVLLQQNSIGKITAFHSFIDVPGPPRSNWYYSSSAIGGASLDTLPYALCRLMSLCRVNVKKVMGFKNQLIKHRHCLDGHDIEPEVDDNATLLMEFNTHQQAIVRSSWNVSQPEDYLIIRGREGDIIIDCWRQQIEVITKKQLAINESSRCNDFIKYRLSINSTNPEQLKLRTFATQIKKRTGNLAEVAYSMKLLFYGLFNKPAQLPPAFYPMQELLLAMHLDDNYI